MTEPDPADTRTEVIVMVDQDLPITMLLTPEDIARVPPDKLHAPEIEPDATA